MILVATIQEGNQFTAIVSRPDLSPHSTSFLAKSGDKSQDTVEGTTLKTTQKSTQKSSQKSSQKIIELVTENHTITTQEMANRLGISRRAIAKAIAILQNNGIIRRVGPDKGGYWEVIEDES
jgi:predicted HTH transcriptional regulator